MIKPLPAICTVFFITLIIFASGCVAPPKPVSISPSQGTGGEPQSSGNETQAVSYVTFETPYQTQTPGNISRTTNATPTLPPEEWIQIYQETRTFAYNATAFSFDLKNPPMVINFSVTPVNVTGTKIKYIKSGEGYTEEQYPFDYYSPYSWFEVTVHDKNSGRILLQDGFGNSYGKQYPQEINRTVKVIDRGNIHIELSGNQITATVDVSVKKKDNIP